MHHGQTIIYNSRSVSPKSPKTKKPSPIYAKVNKNKKSKRVPKIRRNNNRRKHVTKKKPPSPRRDLKPNHLLPTITKMSVW
jgi:hypothetical protein